MMGLCMRNFDQGLRDRSAFPFPPPLLFLHVHGDRVLTFECKANADRCTTASI